MPLYEYYCKKEDRVFEALGSISSSDEPKKCPTCGRKADRIMPTTVATMSRVKGLVERVPFHHHDVRTENKTRPIALVKPDKPKKGAGRKSGAKKKAKKKK
jgi:putative FmdB family regulatory protein